MTVRPPYVCPLCRHPLTWEGGCESCHGTSTGRREEWTFPGDRYELEAGHFVKVAGPRRAMTSAENTLGLADCIAALGDFPPELESPSTLREIPRFTPANDTWFGQLEGKGGPSRRRRGRGR